MKLTIPENIRLDWEILPGVGKTELIQCSMVLVPTLIVFLILGAVLTSPMAPLMLIIIYIILVSFCYFLFAKIDQSQSVYSYIRRGIDFGREQQKFYFTRREEFIDVEIYSEE